MNPQYAVIDLETTVRSERSNKADPFDPKNEIVMGGLWVSSFGETVPPVICEHLGGEDISGTLKDAERPVNLIVGFNLSFDLHYLMRDDPHNFPQWLSTRRIWDCQLAEFILSGQSKIMPSLDECTAKFGKVKDERLKVMWDAGVQTEDMPQDILADYLRDDVLNTHELFLAQMEEAIERNMLPLMETQMEALQATIEMTFNGMCIDTQRLFEDTGAMRLKVGMLRDNLNRYITTLFPELAGFNIESPKQLSLLLFGGTFKKHSKEKVGLYKNGKDKMKATTVDVPFKGFGVVPDPTWKGKDAVMSTSESVLKTIKATATDAVLLTIVEEVLQFREFNKQLSTYYEGLTEHVYPDTYLHHQLNHCVARTGRLTSSKPNLQNVTNGPIRKCFISRFGPRGVLLEADMQQLEIVVLAFLTRDVQLMADLRGGVDMHTELYKSVHHRTPASTERKAFKRAAFALIYGGGCGAIAAQAGISETAAALFKNAFYKRYPDVHKYHTEMTTYVNINGQHRGRKDAGGVPIQEYTFVSVTGRCYEFHEYDAPDWMKKATSTPLLRTFSPTEVKNYPVQGFATADIVPLLVGKLYRELHYDTRLNTKAYLVNTVHDSIVLDVHTDVLRWVVELVERVLNDAPRYLKETFDIDFDLDLKCNITSGPNWSDQYTYLQEEAA